LRVLEEKRITRKWWFLKELKSRQNRSPEKLVLLSVVLLIWFPKKKIGPGKTQWGDRLRRMQRIKVKATMVTVMTTDLKQMTTETPNDDTSSDDENKKIKAKPVPMVASKETQLANMDSNNNTTVEDSANAVPNEEMLAQALQGKIVALSRAQDESGIRRLLSMITNTIVTTGVASLEPVIPDMRVVYKGTTKMKDGTPDETVEKKTDE